MITILITGNCGSGKTWVVKELIKEFNLTTKAKYDYLTNQLNEKVSKAEDKIEKVISDLTLKFSKEV